MIFGLVALCSFVPGTLLFTSCVMEAGTREATEAEAGLANGTEGLAGNSHVGRIQSPIAAQVSGHLPRLVHSRARLGGVRVHVARAGV